MDMIISEIMEMCAYDKDYVREVIARLQDLCDNTFEDFTE